MRRPLADARRILIVRLSALGDVVHALPLLDALRRARPEALIGWAVEARSASLLAGHPQIDRLHVLPRHEIAALLRRGRVIAGLGAAGRFARAMRRERYEVAIDVQCNLRSALTARISGARRRIGFGRGHTKELAHLLLTDRVTPAQPMLKVLKNLELLRPLGIDGRGARAQLATSPEAEAKADGFFASLQGRPAVGLHPGVSAFGAFKRWAPERFAQTARRLEQELGAASVVTWGPGERALAEEVVGGAGGAAVLAPETASILELAALYRRCRVVVGVDTGPVHLAAAIGVPVVGLYGPKDPAIYAPWSARTGQAAETIWKQVHCSPCTLRWCDDVICMPAIQPDEVVAAIARALAEPAAPAPPPPTAAARPGGAA